MNTRYDKNGHGYSWEVLDNGDVEVTVDGDYYSYDAIIPAAEVAGIAEQSSAAAWGANDHPTLRGMI